MRIATDFDEVMVDTGKLKSEVAKEVFGVDVPPRLCRGDSVVGLLSVRQYRAVQWGVSGWQFGLDVEMIPGAVKYTKLLQQEGHTVAVVTARDGEFLEVAKEVVSQQRLSLAFYGVGYEINKATVLKGYDVFLDDMINNLIDAEGVVPHRFLLSREHNEDVVVPPGVIRVSCWCDFYERIHSLVDGVPYSPSLKSRAAAC